METDHYKTTFQTWDKLALIYQEKFMDLNIYDDSYDTFCKLIEKSDARVFEIGCGPGNVTKYLLSRRPDLKIEAIDVSPNMIRLARENNPSADFKVMDCRETGNLNSRYDAIICGFCMPYLSREDCAKLIKDCSSLLNNGGIIYFSAIEGDYNKSGFETSSDGQFKMFVYYHEEDYLHQELKKNNFEPAAIKRIPYPKADEISRHIIFIAKKK